jgi:hypothetical protein
MKTKHIDIVIIAENANEFEDFVPVTGTYSIELTEELTEELTADDIRQSIINWMDADCTVGIFREDGRAITDYVPVEGTWVATKR